MRKKIRIKPRFYIIVFIFISLIGALFYFIANGLTKEGVVHGDKSQILPQESYISIYSNKIYIIYGDKLGIESDVNVYLKKGKKIETLISQENYSELVSLLNGILPEKIENYYISREIDYKGEIVQMPLQEIGGEKFIDSVELCNIFVDNYYKTDEVKKGKAMIDLLNGAGDGKYIDRIAGYLNKKFGYKINVADNDGTTPYTYILNNNLDEDSLRGLSKAIREKYIKNTTSKAINTLANGVIIIGTDKATDFNITIYSKAKQKLIENKLKLRGYINITNVQENKEEQDVIYYNPEDYFTAIKIGELIDIKNIEENGSLLNKIEIHITGGE